MSFATGEQIAALLGRAGDSPFVARAGEAADVVTATMRAYTRQTISEVVDDEALLVGTDARRLVLPERPVVALPVVTLDGDTIDDFRWTRSGALWRDAGWGGPDHEVEVLYDHGYDPVPDDVVQVCRTASARLLANGEGFVRIEVAEGVAETFSGPWGFTIAELLVLNRYRRRTWS